MYMQQQQPQLSTQDFNVAAEIDARNADVYHHRGQVYVLHFLYIIFWHPFSLSGCEYFEKTFVLLYCTAYFVPVCYSNILFAICFLARLMLKVTFIFWVLLLNKAS